MKKKLKNRAMSVRKQGDIVEIRMYSCYSGRDDYFRGKARLNNPEEIRNLLEAAASKGLELPKRESGWWT